jgi:regulatory protein
MPYTKKKKTDAGPSAEGSYSKVMDAALKLLSYRPRTRREMELRLSKKGFRKEVVKRACLRLEEIGYLDDRRFALSWITAHSGSKCRSAWMLIRELKSKGIERSLAESVIKESYDEEDVFRAACHLVKQRVSRAHETDEDKLKARLQNLLLRRGFGYGFIRDVLNETISAKDGGR